MSGSAPEFGPVLPEVVEGGVVGQYAAKRSQAFVQVVQVTDEGGNLLISHSIPTCPGSPPSGAGRDGSERGRRCLNDERPIDRRHHVRSMTFGRSEGKGDRDRNARPPTLETRIGRCILGLRHVLDSSEVSFLHEGDQMIVRHDIMVHGSKHQVEMTLLVRVRFAEDGKAESISVEPADLGLFHHVLNVALKDSAAS